jgi:polar amino acid transport system substrate-binding protein
MWSMVRLVALAVVVLAAVGAIVWSARGDSAVEGSAAGVFMPRERGVLTVATDFPAAGFWEGADVGHVTGGFEHELAQELAARLGLDRVEVVSRPFDDLVDGSAEGFDLALAQVSITRERAELVDLTVPYLTTPVGVVGRPDGRPDGGAVSDLAEARTRRWGVVEATTEIDVVDDLIIPDADATVFATIAEALTAVARRSVDVVALDLVRALAEVEGQPGLSLVAQVTAPQHYGALLPQGSKNLAAVDSAIRSMEADGTLEDMREQLFYGYEVGDAPVVRVTP